MKEIRKDRPLEISEQLLYLCSDDEYDLDFIVNDIIDSDFCYACSEIEETLENIIKNNISEYGNEHKMKIICNNKLLDALKKEMKKKSSIDITYKNKLMAYQDLCEYYGISDDNLKELESIVEDNKQDLLHNISIQDIIDNNKEEIIATIKEDKDLTKYVEDVVDYALNFEGLLKYEKKSLKRIKKAPLYDEDEVERENEINFNKKFIYYLKKLNNNKISLVRKYANEIIDARLDVILNNNYMDEWSLIQPELINLIVKELKREKIDVEVGDVIDYYIEVSKKKENVDVYLPDEEFIGHIVRKLDDDKYKVSIDSKVFDRFFDIEDEEDYKIDLEKDFLDKSGKPKYKTRTYRKF